MGFNCDYCKVYQYESPFVGHQPFSASTERQDMYLDLTPTPHLVFPCKRVRLSCLISVVDCVASLRARHWVLSFFPLYLIQHVCLYAGNT